MVLRIESDSKGPTTRLRLSGRLQSEDIEELRHQMEGAGSQIVLDLAEVTLVDSTTVGFLADCEANGVTLQHVSPYVRACICSERAGGGGGVARPSK